MVKLKKGEYRTSGKPSAKHRRFVSELNYQASQIAKESDEQQLAAYYAIQEIRKNRALSKLK